LLVVVYLRWGVWRGREILSFVDEYVESVSPDVEATLAKILDFYSQKAGINASSPAPEK